MREAAWPFGGGRLAFGLAGALRRAGFLAGAFRGAARFFAGRAFDLAFGALRARPGTPAWGASGSGTAGPAPDAGAWPLKHQVAKCSALGNMAQAALSPSRLKARATTIRGG